MHVPVLNCKNKNNQKNHKSLDLKVFFPDLSSFPWSLSLIASCHEKKGKDQHMSAPRGQTGRGKRVYMKCAHKYSRKSDKEEQLH